MPRNGCFENCVKPEARELAPWEEDRSFSGDIEKPSPDVQAILTVIGRGSATYRREEGRRIDLSGVDLRGVSLEQASLEGVILRNAHLENAILIGAHLEGAHLGAAHFEEAILIGAHLERAYLGEAHFEGANLGGANLEGAYLGGANLEGTDLRNVSGLTQRQFSSADTYEAFQFPHHLRSMKVTEREAFPELTIPDNNPQGIVSEITITGISGVLVDIELTVDIEHTWRGDLKVTLQSPGGVSALIHDRSGDSLRNPEI